MYLKLQYCVSCAIHGKIVRYVKSFEMNLGRTTSKFGLSRALWLILSFAEFVPVKEDVTVHHPHVLGTTRTERRSTQTKPLLRLLLLRELWLVGNAELLTGIWDVFRLSQLSMQEHCLDKYDLIDLMDAFDFIPLICF
jgi:hypothetical protein